MLKIFDQHCPTKISCDASMKGLGAVLEQKHDETWYPIAYASRSLSSSEQNYSQIEKETLSIVFACQKFHDYIYGRKFLIYNDHLHSPFLKNRYTRLHPEYNTSCYAYKNMTLLCIL